MWSGVRRSEFRAVSNCYALSNHKNLPGQSGALLLDANKRVIQKPVLQFSFSNDWPHLPRLGSPPWHLNLETRRLPRDCSRDWPSIG